MAKSKWKCDLNDTYFINKFFLHFKYYFVCVKNFTNVAAAEVRVKRQDDDGDGEVNVDELCHDRPGDEYFRLSTEGDCRDVVR